jgi:hypothetical protein
MKRSAPLRRKTRLVTRKAITRTRMARRATRPKPGADPAYRARVRLLPCAAAHMSGCIGAVDPHHAGERPGVAMKAHDRTCIPLCRGHHDRLHAAQHPFKEWSKERRREWQDDQIRRTQETLDAPPFDAEQDRVDEAAERWPVGEVQIHDA